VIGDRLGPGPEVRVRQQQVSPEQDESRDGQPPGQPIPQAIGLLGVEAATVLVAPDDLPGVISIVIPVINAVVADPPADVV